MIRDSNSLIPNIREEEDENSWEKLTSKRVYESPWVSIDEEEVRGPDSTLNLFSMVRIRPGVMIAALTNTSEVFIVGQHRYAINKFSWEVIGGAIDEGEEALEAAKRELQEETGLIAHRWTCLGNADLGTATLLSKVWFYIAEDLVEGEASPEPSEHLTVQKISLTDAIDMVWTGQITHLPSVALLLKAGEAMRRGGKYNYK